MHLPAGAPNKLLVVPAVLPPAVLLLVFPNENAANSGKDGMYDQLRRKGYARGYDDLPIFAEW